MWRLPVFVWGITAVVAILLGGILARPLSPHTTETLVTGVVLLFDGQRWVARSELVMTQLSLWQRVVTASINIDNEPGSRGAIGWVWRRRVLSTVDARELFPRQNALLLGGELSEIESIVKDLVDRRQIAAAWARTHPETDFDIGYLCRLGGGVLMIFAGGLLGSVVAFRVFSWSELGVRKRRRMRGLCGGCGYPREGLDGTARCPECGESA